MMEEKRGRKRKLGRKGEEERGGDGGGRVGEGKGGGN